MKKQTGRWLPAAAFGIILSVLLAADVLGGTKGFSENENRTLEQMPEISGRKLLDGEFQKKYEEYLSDQFCFRDQWIKIRTSILKACRETDIGDTYIGKDGCYFEKVTPESVDDRIFHRNVRAVRKLFDYESERGLSPEQLQILVVPTAAGVGKEKLPKYARMFDQARYLKEIQRELFGYNVIDAGRALKRAHNEDPGSYLYYKTDHHWTGDGVKEAFEEWVRRTGHSELKNNSYKKRIISSRFRGSMYSRVLDSQSPWDTVWTYEDEGAQKECSVEADGKKLSGFYAEEKLKEKDKYAYFFGGNYGQVRITDPKAAGGNLLVIKDSFANSFVPMLAGFYKKICMLDLRYYKGNIRKYIEDNKITEILILYNSSNFVSDRDIFLLGMK